MTMTPDPILGYPAFIAGSDWYITHSEFKAVAARWTQAWAEHPSPTFDDLFQYAREIVPAFPIDEDTLDQICEEQHDPTAIVINYLLEV